MKKIFVFILGFCLAALLCACAVEEPEKQETASAEIIETVPSPPPTPTPTPEPTPINEWILGKRITTPVSFFEYVGEDISDLDAFAEKFGFSKAIDNGDGTITLVTTVGYYKEFMETVKTFVHENYSKIGPEIDIYCVKSIEHNEDFTKIDVFIDRSLYTGFQPLMLPSAVMLATYFYMAFADQADRYPLVTIIDYETKETIAVYGS